MTVIETPENVLAFWFGDALSDPALASARMPFWFEANEDVDDHIRARFRGTLAAASSGKLTSWVETPHGALAQIIVLDQFPRNLFRGTPDAFRHDPQALAAARAALERFGFDSLHCVEQGFLAMPFQHCEDLPCQDEGVAWFERIVQSAPPQWREFVTGFLDYAKLHRDLIARFGRFPHRNGILGRAATPAEAEFLRDNDENFGQSAKT